MKPGNYTADFAGEKVPLIYVTEVSEAEKIISTLMQQDKLYAIDTETAALPKYARISDAALSPHLSEVRLIQVYTGRTAIVFDVLRLGDPELFRDFLETKRFVGHNSVFDLQFFYKQFGVTTCNIGCTYLIAKLLFHATSATDEGLSASLRSLADVILGKGILKEMQTSNWAEPELTFEQVEYAALDAICTMKVAERLAPKIAKYGLERIYKLYKDAQHPIVMMQLNGMNFDVDAHRDLIVGWRAKLYAAKLNLMQTTGLQKITSTTIANWLEKHLPADILAIWPRTDTGKLSTDSHAFADFDFVDALKPFAEYQKHEKLCTAFGNNLINMVNPETHRLHSSFRLAGARTGRLSCTNPNAQQYPRDNTFRANFIPTGGNRLLVADYSQIELRVGAELSQDRVMLNAYKEGIDLHALTASKIAGKPLKDVTKTERQAAKAFNFGLMFGLGAKKFSHYAKKSYGVDVSTQEAEKGVKTFRDTYSGYRAWQNKQSENAAASLCATTVCGKRRRLDKDNYYGPSMNTPVQGSAAECMLHALCCLHETGLTKYLVNCVHDELILDVPNLAVDGNVYKDDLEKCMVNGFTSVFPDGCTRDLVAAHYGKNWAEAKE